MGILTFCVQCGARRVRDVSDELEKLLTSNEITSGQCGICFKHVASELKSSACDVQPGTVDHIQSESSSSSSASSIRESENDNKIPTHADCNENLRKEATQANQPLSEQDCKSDDKRDNICLISKDERHRCTCTDQPKSSTSMCGCEVHAISSNTSEACRKRTSSKVKTNKIERYQSDDESVDIPFDSFKDDSDVDEVESTRSCDSELKKRFNRKRKPKKAKVDKNMLSPEKTQHLKKADTKLTELTEWELKLRRALDPKVLSMVDIESPPTRALVCKECKLGFIQVQRFISHIRCHFGKVLMIPKPYVCPVCSCRIINFTGMQRHMARHTQDKMYACPWEGCNSAFACQRYVRKHITGKHKGNYTLQRKVKKFQCTMCDHKTSSRSALKLHLNKHTNARPFKCRFCDKCFNHRSTKNNHEGNIHSKSTDRHCICEICGYSSYYKHDLEKHQRMHSGDKPFACDQCEYRCSRRDNLKKHLKIHSADKKYKCNYCDTIFNTLKTCKIHEKSHGQLKSSSLIDSHEIKQITQGIECQTGKKVTEPTDHSTYTISSIPVPVKHSMQSSCSTNEQGQTQPDEWVRAVDILQHLHQM